MHLLLLKFIESVGLLVPVEIPRHATRPEIKVLSYYKDPRLYCLYFSGVITDDSLINKDNRKDHKWVFAMPQKNHFSFTKETKRILFSEMGRIQMFIKPFSQKIKSKK